MFITLWHFYIYNVQLSEIVSIYALKHNLIIKSKRQYANWSINVLKH